MTGENALLISMSLRIFVTYIFTTMNNITINVPLYKALSISLIFSLDKFLGRESYGHCKPTMYWKIHFHKVLL